MSNNLGDYQWIVNESKRVGGPKVFCAQMRAEGAVVGAAAVAIAVIGIYFLHKKYFKKRRRNFYLYRWRNFLATYKNDRFFRFYYSSCNC